MININKKIETMVKKISENGTNGILDVNVEFTDIDKKKEVLSDYLETSLEEISYDKSRNLFIAQSSEDAYNVLKEEEADTQAFMNMIYNIEGDCAYISPESATTIMNIDVSFINENLPVGKDAPDMISSLDLYNFVMENENIDIKDFFYNYTNHFNKKDFLSCHYREEYFKDMYIYQFE